MIILSLRTDKPEAEMGLFDDKTKLHHETWHAHRELAETIHSKLQDVVSSKRYALGDVQGIVCYKGPGSFTGLRIGLSVANALAHALNVPILGMTGDDWLERGLDELVAGKGQANVLPEYGAPVHITTPKK